MFARKFGKNSDKLFEMICGKVTALNNNYVETEEYFYEKFH